MNIFVMVSIIIPIVLFIGLPWTWKRVVGKEPPRDALLLAACALFAISWYLPSPLIHGMQTEFTTHFLGGGVFCGLLWLYIKRHAKWNASWWIEGASLYALVSVLGVTNELFELFVSELHLTRMTGRDTWWDLLANTLGAAVFWAIYRIITYFRTRM